ncbi:DNA damage-regulated autophagy modulator protein 1, partial [Paragonimus heterotremus]
VVCLLLIIWRGVLSLSGILSEWWAIPFLVGCLFGSACKCLGTYHCCSRHFLLATSVFDVNCCYVYLVFAISLSACSRPGTFCVYASQETSVLTVHLIGALMTFGFGTLYTIMISHASRAHFDSPKWLRTLRITLAVTCSVAFVAMFLFAGLSNKGISLPHKWEPGEKGYIAHTLSVTCEWLLAVCFLSFFFTMIFDLRDYTMDPIKVRHRYANLDREVLIVSV